MGSQHPQISWEPSPRFLVSLHFTHHICKMETVDGARDQWSGFGMVETARVVTSNCRTIPLPSGCHHLPCQSPAISSYLPCSSWTLQLSSYLISPQSLMHLTIPFLQFSAPLASGTLGLFWFFTHLSDTASIPLLSFPSLLLLGHGVPRSPDLGLPLLILHDLFIHLMLPLGCWFLIHLPSPNFLCVSYIKRFMGHVHLDVPKAFPSQHI